MAEPDMEINPQLSISSAEQAFNFDHEILATSLESLTLENGRIPSPKASTRDQLDEEELSTEVDKAASTGQAGAQRPKLPGLGNTVNTNVADIYEADWLKSPKSPSSMFSSSELPDASRGIISGILLCYWDNILGPKICHLWASQLKDTPMEMKTLKFIANHTLSGEICRDLMDPTVDSKFYVWKDKRVVVTAFVFGAMSKGDLAVHSLSVIIPHAELASYLHWHQLCVSHITRVVAKLRVLLEKRPPESAIESFSMELSDFANLFKSLQEASLPSSIPLTDTIFGAEHPVDQSFLKRAITSHLMTCGHSVVLGNSPRKINQMVATLALFLSPSERLCCRYVVSDQPWTYLYHPELSVQGIVKGSDVNLAFYLQGVYMSHYPSSLIDLSTREVRLSSLPHQHWLKRQEALKNEMTALWNGQEAGYPTGDILRSFDDPETLVTNFFDEMTVIGPGHFLRQTYPDLFMQLLERKALTLLRHIQAQSHHGKVQLRQHIKKLRQDLSLTVPGDFKIVLATAERLRPGTYYLVCGDADHAQSVLDNL